MRVNGTRIDNPAKGIAIGDVVTVAAAHGTAAVRVSILGRRVPPARRNGLCRPVGGPERRADDQGLIVAAKTEWRECVPVTSPERP